MTKALSIHNRGNAALGKVPCLDFSEFREFVIESVERGDHIASLFASRTDAERLRIFVVLASSESGMLNITSTEVGEQYQSLTPDCPQAHLFEREIAEQWRIEPAGHPWLKPIRFQLPMRDPKGSTPYAAPKCGLTDFFEISGEEIHEVAVGPVHAGVIEPGHFRFQCHGETVYHLEISLGYQHRGVERGLVGGPDKRAIHYIETLAGDTTIAHALAYCSNVESLAKLSVPPRADAIRAVAQELERVANHIGDLGALSGDVGFLPTQSYCGRIRGDVLNLTAELCGNRFGRGLVCPGGVRFDVSDELASRLRERLDQVLIDTTSAVELLWESPSVLARFEGTGVLEKDVCEELGIVGVAARACGVSRDVRSDFPYGMFRFAHIPTVTWPTGDVLARALVRWREVQRSITFAREQLASLPAGPRIGPMTSHSLAPNRISVSMTEGWRGEVCHTVITDSEGRFIRYKVVDPSFHNWLALAYSMKNGQISDFPLCNKSFNLSYCGHDL